MLTIARHQNDNTNMILHSRVCSHLLRYTMNGVVSKLLFLGVQKAGRHRATITIVSEGREQSCSRASE